jgi:hypothetical protein
MAMCIRRRMYRVKSQVTSIVVLLIWRADWRFRSHNRHTHCGKAMLVLSSGLCVLYELICVGACNEVRYL